MRESNAKKLIGIVDSRSAKRAIRGHFALEAQNNGPCVEDITDITALKTQNLLACRAIDPPPHVEVCCTGGQSHKPFHESQTEHIINNLQTSIVIIIHQLFSYYAL